METILDTTAIFEKTLAGLGYELVHHVMHARGGLLRVYIDRPAGVTLDDCVFVSSHLSRVLAAENIQYQRLEVSSPGVDRPLRRAEDFRRFLGRQAQVRTRVGIQGRKRFTGTIRDSTPEYVLFEVDDEVLRIDMANIERARLIPDLQVGGHP